MNFIKRIFTGMKQEAEPESSVMAEEVEKSTVAEVSQPEPQPETETPSNFPVVRSVIQISAISEGVFPKDSDEVSIKAQPTPTGDQCLFTVNRPLMRGYSWYFSDFESATESSLAEALFCLDDVEAVLVCESTVTVTRKDKTLVD